MSSPKLRTVTIGAVLFQFSLAVLGEGGLRAYFSHPPLIAIAVLIVTLTIAALLSEGSMSSGEREDRSNRWVLLVFGLLLLAIAILPPFTDRVDFLTVDGDAVRWLGVALFAAGGVLRLWPVFTLGRRFSAWWRSNRGIGWSPPAFIAAFAIRATWECWSTRWDGGWHFAQSLDCCSPRC